MTDVEFGRLTDIALRRAWPDEARDFTPWLAANIDHLGEAIGIDLEMVTKEAAVGPFSADIFAQSRRDGVPVLIENQLETSDHSHLGQVLTYLAGLEARIVVWVAPSFREQHLSAIAWLNAHTAAEFSFFAVRLRVVRIGSSPLAPIFEVVEKPNDWDRQIKQAAAGEGAAYYDVKQRFWQAVLARHPGLEALGVKGYRYSNNYISLGEDPRADLSLYLARNESGIFLRSGRGEGPEALLECLEPHRDTIEARFGVPLGPSPRGHFLVCTFPKGQEQPEAWDEIADWIFARVAEFREVLAPLLQRGQGSAGLASTSGPGREPPFAGA